MGEKIDTSCSVAGLKLRRGAREGGQRFADGPSMVDLYVHVYKNERGTCFTGAASLIRSFYRQ